MSECYVLLPYRTGQHAARVGLASGCLIQQSKGSGVGLAAQELSSRLLARDVCLSAALSSLSAAHSQAHSQQLSLSSSHSLAVVVFFPPVNFVFVFRRELSKAEQSSSSSSGGCPSPSSRPPPPRERCLSFGHQLAGAAFVRLLRCVYLRVPAGVHLQACICAGVCFKSLLQV